MRNAGKKLHGEDMVLTARGSGDKQQKAPQARPYATLGETYQADFQAEEAEKAKSKLWGVGVPHDTEPPT